MSERICCICKKLIESEEPSVLTVSSFGNPRYLCDGCDSDFETALSGKEYADIKEAVGRIGEKMENSLVEDELVIGEVGELLDKASERAEAILDGSYDFSLDGEMTDEEAEAESEAALTLAEEEPEETEEEKGARLKKERTLKIVDTVTTWAVALAIVGAIAYFIIKIVS